jgi:hypothetical protein
MSMPMNLVLSNALRRQNNEPTTDVPDISVSGYVTNIPLSLETTNESSLSLHNASPTEISWFSAMRQ